jgi:hypothetical protein
MKSYRRLVLVVWIFVDGLQAVSSAFTTTCRGHQPASATTALFAVQDTSSSRSAFLSSIGAAATALTVAVVVSGGPPPALAGDDASLKGTKKDPAFEVCLSKCMYECTKPKGAEQKSRMECLPECRQKCATTKAQLLKGEPIPKRD